MKGDYTRFTFRPERHYSSVRMQQGRVQTDADWNEQVDIQAHQQQTLTKDFIGPSGAPRQGGGFVITTAASLTDPPVPLSDLAFSAGRIYVDGLLCEMEQTCRLTDQPYVAPALTLPTERGTYLVYLDVWQRHITALEDPGIREVALGGPDSGTRVQNLWQLKTQKLSDATPSDLAAFSQAQDGPYAAWLPPTAPSTGQLTPVFTADATQPLENRLYRVEIHQGGTLTESGGGPVITKWSRDNGALVAPWLDSPASNTVTIEAARRDETLSFASGQLAELSGDQTELSGEVTSLLNIYQVVDTGGATLDLHLNNGSAPARGSVGSNPKVRRWDGTASVSQAHGAGSPGVALEQGLAIKLAAGTYNTGDYWLIPARSASGGELEWPLVNGTFAAQAAQRVQHHYYRLALFQIIGGADPGTLSTNVLDCCWRFPSLVDLRYDDMAAHVRLNDQLGDMQELADATVTVKGILDLPDIKAHQLDRTLDSSVIAGPYEAGSFIVAMPYYDQRGAGPGARRYRFLKPKQVFATVNAQSGAPSAPLYTTDDMQESTFTLAVPREADTPAPSPPTYHMRPSRVSWQATGVLNPCYGIGALTATNGDVHVFVSTRFGDVRSLQRSGGSWQVWTNLGSRQDSDSFWLAASAPMPFVGSASVMGAYFYAPDGSLLSLNSLAATTAEVSYNHHGPWQWSYHGFSFVGQPSLVIAPGGPARLYAVNWNVYNSTASLMENSQITENSQLFNSTSSPGQSLASNPCAYINASSQAAVLVCGTDQKLYRYTTGGVGGPQWETQALRPYADPSRRVQVGTVAITPALTDPNGVTSALLYFQTPPGGTIAPAYELVTDADGHWQWGSEMFSPLPNPILMSGDSAGVSLTLEGLVGSNKRVGFAIASDGVNLLRVTWDVARADPTTPQGTWTSQVIGPLPGTTAACAPYAVRYAPGQVAGFIVGANGHVFEITPALHIVDHGRPWTPRGPW